MKKFFTLLLCLVLLTSCGQESLPPENPPTVSQPEEKIFTVEQESLSQDLTKEKAPEVTTSSAEDVSSNTVSKSVNIVVTGLEGDILYSASAPYREGITVFDLLLETAKEKNIPVVFTGSKSSPYVTSIYGLSEKQHGPSSGWIYTVNGQSIMVSSSKCILNPDDIAEWKYITEF